MHQELKDLADPQYYVGAIDISEEPKANIERFLKQMLLIRRVEEKLGDKITDGTIKCPCHLAIGQEAVAVGVASQLRTTDRAFGTHRSHSHYLAMGGGTYELMAEVLGKATGCSHGMGGSMHLWADDKGFKGSVPIVAGTVSMGVGAALAAEMDFRRSQTPAKTPTGLKTGPLRDVGVAFFGDGAAEEGSVHESLNMASVMNLPMIFVVENNLFSSHLHIGLRQPSNRVARYAEAHKVRVEVVDGNDVIAVKQAAARLIDAARNGRGPGFLEAVTYRWRGHVGPREDLDVGLQRKDDLTAWKRRDPVRRLQESMMLMGEWSEAEITGINDAVCAEVEEAWIQAEKAPYPREAALWDYVFAPNSMEVRA